MNERKLAEVLEALRTKHDLPALGASVINRGQTLTAVTGFRKAGDPTRATLRDKFHLGSCTKTMTATMIALQVEQGKLRWATSLSEIFPDIALHSDCKAITIEQLLRHRAGMPSPERSYPAGVNWYSLSGSPRQQRRQYLQAVLTRQPDFVPGQRAQYSNTGYVVLGAVLEQLHQQDWEQLARRMLFEPLGMRSAGFGPMASAGKVNQPWQHRVVDGRMSTMDFQNSPRFEPWRGLKLTSFVWGLGSLRSGRHNPTVPKATPQSTSGSQRFASPSVVEVKERSDRTQQAPSRYPNRYNTLAVRRSLYAKAEEC